MTLAETTQMLEAAGVSMDAGHVRRLWEHTEGWVGALRLAALPLRDHPDPGAFVDDFAGDDRAISDYLISEVMSRMSAGDRDFLLRTSIVAVLQRRARGHAHRPRRRPPAPGRAGARRPAAGAAGPARRVVPLSRAVPRAAPGRAAQRRGGAAAGAAPARRGLAGRQRRRRRRADPRGRGRGLGSRRAAGRRTLGRPAAARRGRRAGAADRPAAERVGGRGPGGRARRRQRSARSRRPRRGGEAARARRRGRGPRAGRAPTPLRRLVQRAPAARRAPARRPRGGAGDRARAVAPRRARGRARSTRTCARSRS